MRKEPKPFRDVTCDICGQKTKAGLLEEHKRLWCNPKPAPAPVVGASAQDRGNPEDAHEAKLRKWSGEFLATQIKRGVPERVANAASIVFYEYMCAAYDLARKLYKPKAEGPKCPKCGSGKLLIDWDKGTMGCSRCPFIGSAKEFFAAPSDPQPAHLNKMLGEALGCVKTMQATLEDIRDTCKNYADAPTLTKATALGTVRKVQKK